MRAFLARRFLHAGVSLFVMTLLLFGAVRLTGDPVLALLPEDATPEQYENLQHALGFDRPLHEQYFVYVGEVATGDLGTSIRSGTPVARLIAERAPATAQLGLAALAIGFTTAIPLGVYSAAFHRRLFDWLSRGIALFGQSVPTFWFGILSIQVFAVWLGLLPAGGTGNATNLILPAAVLGIHIMAGLMRLTRSAMLEVLDSEYVKMARSKGVTEHVVLWRHAFRNAAIPVLTYATLITVAMLTGAVAVETVFAWPGLGRLVIDSVRLRDFPVVQGVLLMFAGFYIVMNLLADIMYAYLNPRIKY